MKKIFTFLLISSGTCFSIEPLNANDAPIKIKDRDMRTAILDILERSIEFENSDATKNFINDCSLIKDSMGQIQEISQTTIESSTDLEDINLTEFLINQNRYIKECFQFIKETLSPYTSTTFTVESIGLELIPVRDYFVHHYELIGDKCLLSIDDANRLRTLSTLYYREMTQISDALQLAVK